jgi:hypothetical protein
VLARSAINRPASGEAFCESKLVLRENMQSSNDTQAKTPVLVKYQG